MNELVFEEEVVYVSGTAISIEECRIPKFILIIRNVYIYKTTEFDPLIKIWSSVRRRIREKHNADIIANRFIYNNDSGTIRCEFLLNTVAAYQKDVSDEEYRKKFSEQISIFKEAIKKFIEQEDGYTAYLGLALKEDGGEKEYDKFFDDFLKKIKIRTKDDEIGKAEEAAERARLLKEINYKKDK